MNPIHFKKFSA